MKDIDYFLSMMKLQDSFNKGVSKDWKLRNYDWVNYIMIESAEQNASLDFKHWKEGVDDLDNFKVEVIDNWHFLMSMFMVEYSDELIARLCEEEFYNNSYQDEDLTTLTKFFCYKVLEYEFDKKSELVGTILVILFNLMHHLGIETPEDLYREYLVKNVLNKIRQDNGYKDGSYTKIWRELPKLEGTDYQEDNVIAYEKAYELQDNNDLTYDSLYDTLQTYYDESVIN